MNSISWLIYSIDVLESLKGILIAFALVGWIPIAAGVAVFFAEGFRVPYLRAGFVTYFLAILLVIFIPSSKTIYMIAASEIGEKAIKTEMAGDLFEIVQKEIKKLKEAK